VALPAWRILAGLVHQDKCRCVVRSALTSPGSPARHRGTGSAERAGWTPATACAPRPAGRCAGASRPPDRGPRPNTYRDRCKWVSSMLRHRGNLQSAGKAREQHRRSVEGKATDQARVDSPVLCTRALNLYVCGRHLVENGSAIWCPTSSPLCWSRGRPQRRSAAGRPGPGCQGPPHPSPGTATRRTSSAPTAAASASSTRTCGMAGSSLTRRTGARHDWAFPPLLPLLRCITPGFDCYHS